MSVEIKISLWLGHFLANFAFQNEQMFYQKKTNLLYLIGGSVIWTATIWLILNHYNLASDNDIYILYVPHFLISYWRVTRKSKRHIFKLYLFFEWVVNAGQIYLAYKY